MRDNDQRFILFCGYINELQQIKGLAPCDPVDLFNRYRSYVSEEHLLWIDIFDDNSPGTLIGFLLIGTPPNCHPDADFYIEEAYILPTYRRRGYMSSAVVRFVKAHPGTYCMFILKRNSVAHIFWPRVFGKLGYSPIFLADVGAGDPYCEQYGFEKNVLSAVLSV